MMTPEPSPFSVRTTTTLGCTAAAMSASEERSMLGAALKTLVTGFEDTRVPLSCSEEPKYPPAVPTPPARTAIATAVRSVLPARRGGWPAKGVVDEVGGYVGIC